MIDTFDHLASLERWFFGTFLPRLTEEVLVVLAGRAALSSVWRTDPGWETLIHTVALQNLSVEESCAYLARMGIQEEQCDAVFQVTHGHPLALALASPAFQMC